MNTIAARLKHWPRRQPGLFLALAALSWIALYQSLATLSEALAGMLPVARGSRLGSALQFFFYDTPKVMLLLAGIVFVMGIVHTFVSPERTRALLSGRRLGTGNVMAAVLGIVTPFCSCSAVPLFIGFLQAGVPLGVTFSFLLSAPMVNEVALVLLYGLFGWKIAAIYAGTGVAIATVCGWVIGRLGMERHVEEWVYDASGDVAPAGHGGEDSPPRLSWRDRYRPSRSVRSAARLRFAPVRRPVSDKGAPPRRSPAHLGSGNGAADRS